MKYVIAGSHSQFVHWCVENGVNPRSHQDARYIDNETKLLGLRDVDIITYGTYYERPDWIQIQGRLIQMKRAGDLKKDSEK